MHVFTTPRSTCLHHTKLVEFKAVTTFTFLRAIWYLTFTVNMVSYVLDINGFEAIFICLVVDVGSEAFTIVDGCYISYNYLLGIRIT
jgi:hypothetical protein